MIAKVDIINKAGVWAKKIRGFLDFGLTIFWGLNQESAMDSICEIYIQHLHRL